MIGEIIKTKRRSKQDNILQYNTFYLIMFYLKCNTLFAKYFVWKSFVDLGKRIPCGDIWLATVNVRCYGKLSVIVVTNPWKLQSIYNSLREASDPGMIYIFFTGCEWIIFPTPVVKWTNTHWFLCSLVPINLSVSSHVLPWCYKYVATVRHCRLTQLSRFLFLYVLVSIINKCMYEIDNWKGQLDFKFNILFHHL